MYHDKSLLVYGTLHVQGTPTDTIRFTSAAAAPAQGDWGQILFTDTSTDSVLDYVTIEHGGQQELALTQPMIEVDSDALLVEHSVVRLSKEAGLKINGASPTIEHSDFTENSGDGIQVDGGNPIITYNSLWENDG